MIKTITDTAAAFKLVWVRVACYFFIPAGMLFLSQTETWSQSTWDALGAFMKGRLYIACIICGLNGLCAYIDSSYAKAREEARVMKVARADAAEAKIDLRTTPPGQ